MQRHKPRPSNYWCFSKPKKAFKKTLAASKAPLVVGKPGPRLAGCVQACVISTSRRGAAPSEVVLCGKTMENEFFPWAKVAGSLKKRPKELLEKKQKPGRKAVENHGVHLGTSWFYLFFPVNKVVRSSSSPEELAPKTAACKVPQGLRGWESPRAWKVKNWLCLR